MTGADRNEIRFAKTGNTPLKEERGKLYVKGKKSKTIDPANLDPDEKLKYEVAEEIGLLDKVMTEGWKSLTSKETGRIGGLVTRKKKQRSGGQNISLQR